MKFAPNNPGRPIFFPRRSAGSLMFNPGAEITEIGNC